MCELLTSLKLEFANNTHKRESGKHDSTIWFKWEESQDVYLVYNNKTRPYININTIPKLLKQIEIEINKDITKFQTSFARSLLNMFSALRLNWISHDMFQVVKD